MNFSTKTIGGDVEILASKDYQAIPIKVATPGEGTVVKAGTPLTSAGIATTGENAVGILLYDVDTAMNPNGAAVVIGIINAIVAQEHSGVSYNASNLKAALPGVEIITDRACEIMDDYNATYHIPDFNNGQGLYVEFFNNRNFSGKPVATGYYDRINFSTFGAMKVPCISVARICSLFLETCKYMLLVVSISAWRSQDLTASRSQPLSNKILAVLCLRS